jgi:pilus assembly protein CpaB
VDTRRLAIAVAVALVLSLCATGLFWTRFNRLQAANRAKTVKIIAAAKDIQPGVPVTAASLKRIDWPSSLGSLGLVTKEDEIVGRVLITSVAENEPILAHDVSSPGNSGLSSRIPDGLRAVAVKTNEVNNLAGFLFPGSRVDVLATVRGDRNESFNRTVLQNVQVISAGEKIVADPNGKPENVKIVTLLVTPLESQKLALVMEQGTIQLALRNQHDDQTVETTTLSMSDLEDLGHKPVQRPTVVAKAAPPKVAPVYAVETIAGAKSSISTFSDRTVR